MDTWEKSAALETFADSLHIQAELDNALRDKTGKQEWLDAFRQRADQLDALYEQNRALAASIREAQDEPLTAEAAEFLYQKLLKRKSLRQPTRVVMPVLALLIPYYEANRDPEKLIQLYSVIYRLMTSAEQVSPEGDPVPRTKYSRAIIGLRDQYSAIRDVRSRIEIFAAYYMICVSERADGLISADESYRYLQEMLSLWNSRTVQKLDGDNEHILWYISQTQRDWLAVEECIDEASPDTRAYFCQQAEDCWQEEQDFNDELWQYDHAVCAAYYHARVLEKEMTWSEALMAYFTYYVDRMLRLDDPCYDTDAGDSAELDQADFLLGAPLVLERWGRRCGDPHLEAQVLEQLKVDTHATLIRKFAGLPDLSVVNSLSRWCFTMLPHLDSREEKEEWLFNLVVRKHFSIYLHSVMVERLTQAIAAPLLRDHPQLFREAEALAAPQHLSDYISKCALFHDVGKTRIAEIINTQVRDLEQDELEAIRLHADYGCALIGGDPDLARYKDVILGHHKFYNGQGGYPKSFNNTASPYRFVIDLITICDCLDAATDTLGRNYKREKPFDQVLEEFIRDKGVRYNPDIVDYIQGSPELQDTLRYLVGEARGETAYEIYSLASRA